MPHDFHHITLRVVDLDHDRFSEYHIGLDHIAIGVSVDQVGRLAEVLEAAASPTVA